MITKKKDAVEQLEQYRELFTRKGLFGVECTVRFDMHESDGFIINDLKPITLKDVKNKPDKVEHEGKKRSPMLFQIENNQAPLIFAFDTTLVAPLANGVRFTVKLDKPLNDKSVIEVDIRLAQG